MIEIEVKARCNLGDVDIQKLGGVFVKQEVQEDVYYNHPLRDFRETDEALRVRSIDGRHYLCYKGPRLSGKAKVREEIEVTVD